jgi:hypothetical protein
MSSIWVQGTQGWELLLPHGFEDEATLHDLISDAPQVLPLSGSPRLVVLGREVPLGPGLADIVAVETGGRPVVIEVKLARSPEARRAVIAQLLSYAASLYRSTPGAFAAAVARSITGAGHGTILEAVEAADQEESVDPTTFAESLRQSLESGDIRLVLVLDSAPPELQAVVGYLEAVAPNLTLDLVTVPAFRVGERAVVIPQRIEPARVPPRGPLEDRGRVPLPAPSAVHSDGSAEFRGRYRGFTAGAATGAAAPVGLGTGPRGARLGAPPHRSGPTALDPSARRDGSRCRTGDGMERPRDRSIDGPVAKHLDQVGAEVAHADGGP